MSKFIMHMKEALAKALWKTLDDTYEEVVAQSADPELAEKLWFGGLVNEVMNATIVEFTNIATGVFDKPTDRRPKGLAITLEEWDALPPEQQSMLETQSRGYVMPIDDHPTIQANLASWAELLSRPPEDNEDVVQ